MVAKFKRSKLSKWLIAEDVNCTRWFIVHTQFPRFIGEIFDDEETGGNIIGSPKGKIELIDEPLFITATLANLMREAGDALLKYDKINEIKAEQARSEEEEENLNED